MLLHTLQSWWDCFLSWIEPRGISEPLQRHRMRLLNGIVVVFAPFAVLVAAADALTTRRQLNLENAPVIIALTSAVLLCLIFYLAQRGLFRLSTWGLFLLALGCVLAVAIQSDPPHLEILYLVIIPMLATLFFGVRMTLVFSFLSLVIMRVFMQVEQVPAPVVTDVTWLFLVVCVFFFFLLHQRHLLERDRNCSEAQRIALEAEREQTRLIHDFMRGAAHDLRTPLTILNTTLYLLEKTQDSEIAATRRATMQQMLKRMETMLDTMFLMVRVESGALPDPQPVDIRAVIEQAARRVKPAADRRGIALELRFETALLHTDGHAEELELALMHVINNAVQYSRPGGEVRVRAYQDEQSALVIDVIDDGIGIAPEHLPHIFERFYRVDQHRPIDESHAGLGLALTRQITERHGGTISAESTVGQGSLFRLRLPAEEQPARAAARAAKPIIKTQLKTPPVF